MALMQLEINSIIENLSVDYKNVNWINFSAQFYNCIN